MVDEKEIKKPAQGEIITASSSKNKEEEKATAKEEKVITLIKLSSADIYFDLPPKEVEKILEKEKETWEIFLYYLEEEENTIIEANDKINTEEVKRFCREKLKIVKVESKREKEEKTKTEIDQQINRTNQLIENAKLFDGENVGEVLDKIGKEVYDYYFGQESQRRLRKIRNPDPISVLGQITLEIASALSGYNTDLSNEWKNKAKEEVIKSASEIVTRSNNQVKQFAQELLVNKQVLIRVKEVMTDKEREAEAKISKLQTEVKERDTRISQALEEYQRKEAIQRKREEEAIEKQKQEKQREAEQARLLGEAQKALLSAEKKEIEQLRDERNELRTNTEEQEKFLNRWIKEYERLELDKSVAVHTVLKYDAIIKQRDSEIEQKNAQLTIIEDKHTALVADKAALQERSKNLDQEIKALENNYNEAIKERDNWHQQKNQLEIQNLAISQKIKELEAEKIFLNKEKANLESERAQLEVDKADLEKKLEKAIQQKRIGLIANVAQGAIDWLPIPKKWQGGLKTGIQAVSAWALFKDLPNWTYEGFIMVTGVGLWYAMIYTLRKVNHFIFGKKDKKQISNLEKALTNIFEAGVIGKEKKESKKLANKETETSQATEKREKEKPTIIINNSPPAEKEPNQPAALNKEPVNQGEISSQEKRKRRKDKRNRKKRK